MYSRAALVLIVAMLTTACSPKETSEPQAAADAAPDRQPDQAAPADQGAALDQGAQAAAVKDETVSPDPAPAPPKEPDSAELPFEDPPVARGVVWLNAYPGYTKTSKIKVRRMEINVDNQDPEFSLYETTSTDAKQVGVIKYAHGEEVRWRRSRVIIEEPRPFVAEEAVVLTDLYYAKPEIPDVGEKHPDIKLKKGDKMVLYFFGEVGHCYIGQPGGPMLYGPCLEAPKFSNPTKPENYAMAPLHAERWTWWLLVQKGDKVGWMPVDRRYFSHDPKY